MANSQPHATSRALFSGSAAPTDQDLQARTESEDVQFFSYIRRHLGLLATVATLPIISGIVGVLPTPVFDSTLSQADNLNRDLKLNVLSSFLCLITFAAAILQRGLFKRWIASDRWYKRLSPPLITLGSSLTGALAAIYYIYLIKAGASIELRAGWYLLIFPSFVFGLGTILATAFAQDVSLGIQNLVLARLPERQEEVLETVQQYADFLDLDREFHKKYGGQIDTSQPVTRKERHFSALGSVGQSLLYDYRNQLENLSRGRVEVGVENAAKVHHLLIKHFHSRFDAVSDQDLEFWAGEKDPHLSEEYFRLNRDLLERGAKVTRIFIFGEKELLNPDTRKKIVTVLDLQFKTGIGWAVAVNEELSPGVTRLDGTKRDFAFLDDDRVVTFFRDMRHSSRRLCTSFNTANNNREIDRQIHLYNDLLTQCWMASSDFIKNCRLSIAKIPEGIQEDWVERAIEFHRSPRFDVIQMSTARLRSLFKPEYRKLLRLSLDTLIVHQRLKLAREEVQERLALGGHGKIFPIEVGKPEDIPKAVETLCVMRKASRAFLGPRPSEEHPTAISPAAPASSAAHESNGNNTSGSPPPNPLGEQIAREGVREES